MTGKHLQDIMLKEGYSVNRMAQLIGKSQPVLASALKHDDVRTGLLEDIAKAMGKPLAFFYGENYGNVSQVSGNNNTSVAGNENNISNDKELIELLKMKEVSLSKAQEHLSQSQQSLLNSQEQVTMLIGKLK